MNKNMIMKIFIFILLIIIMSIIFFNYALGLSLSYQSVSKIKNSRIQKNDLINNLKINNIDTVYDKNSNTYFYHIPDNYENSKYILQLNLKKGYKYKIFKHNLNIIKVDYKKNVQVIIYNDDYYTTINIQLTNLPIVSFSTTDEIGINDINTSFKYINSTLSQKSTLYNSKIHIRGATSKGLEKKSYKIKVFDSSYKDEKNIYLSNLNYNSSFILQSLYSDPSRIRNKLSTELWNYISSDFTNAEIRSEYVELIINNEYMGLYILSDGINRKNLKLNKDYEENLSFIIKSSVDNISGDSLNKHSISYLDQGFEIKYPNEEKSYEEVLQLFYSTITDFYSEDKKNTYSVISNTFNLENYIDIVVFNSFTNNIDSNLLKKNVYFYLKNLKDKKLFIYPWDMELSYGLYYCDNSKYHSIIKEDTYNDMDFPFYHEYAPKINQLLIERYKKLRKNVLALDYIDSKIDNYKNELTKGSALRDSNLWYKYDIDNEIEKVRTWIHKRIKYFDNYVEDLENEQ